MKIEIRHRWNQSILFSVEVTSLKAAVEAAVAQGADLTDANLTGANLTDANLTDANLRGANLTGADLTDANLRGANLRGADLTDANLRGANLRGANLTGADLTDANLRGANLTGADLRGANLTDANLTDANLTDANLRPVRDDLWAVLSSAPAEVPGLLAALRDGKIDGSTYQGECACLVGTIAKVRHCNYRDIPGLKPNSWRPAEMFFAAIRPGHTPENSAAAKIAEGWISEWLERMQAAFGPKEIA